MHGDAAIKILLSAEPMMLLMMNELSMAFAEKMFPPPQYVTLAGLVLTLR
jgi:hypothetical protein